MILRVIQQVFVEHFAILKMLSWVWRSWSKQVGHDLHWENLKFYWGLDNTAIRF